MDVLPVRTALPPYRGARDASDILAERRRRLLASLGSSTGFFASIARNPVASARQPTSPQPRPRFQSYSHVARDARLRQALQSLAPLADTTVNGNDSGDREARGHGAAAGTAPNATAAEDKHAGSGDDAAKVQAVSVPLTHVSCADLEDPLRDYDITLTDLLNVFHKIDSQGLGSIVHSQFERAMLELGFLPVESARLFRELDVDKDGVLAVSDWTSPSVRRLAIALTSKIVRGDITGRDPGSYRAKTLSMTEKKIAMEMLLNRLGVKAKSNFITIRDAFNAVDADGSGDIDSEELATTVERILRKKITRGIKHELVRKFDKNGDGVISSSEFLNRVVSNPISTLYSFLPSNVCLT